MSHSRKKKNNRVNTSPVQQAISDDLKNELNNLQKLYQKIYVFFYESREENLICKRGDETKNNMTAMLLLEAFNKIMPPISDIVCKQKNYANEALLLYCKIKVLAGHYMYEYDDRSLGLCLYADVIRCINEHDKYLKYENDVFFQEQIACVFDVVSRQSLDETKLDKDMAKQFSEIMSENKLAYSIFKKKCGATILSLIISHNELEKSYINSHTLGFSWERLNRDYKNNRDSFFSLAGKVKASFEKMKRENTFSTLYQIYYLELNYCMMNITELAHPRRLWMVQNMNADQTVYVQRNVGYAEIKNYFNFWQRVKEDYIHPSLSLIESINTDEINGSIQLRRHYAPQVKSWLNVILMTIDFLRNTVESWMSSIESGKTVPEYLLKEFYEYLLKLEAEKEMLMSSAAIITNSANKIKFKLTETLHEHSKKLLDNSDTLETKVRELKSRMEKLENEKLKAANATAEKLISEETQIKKEKAKKYHLRYLKSLHQVVAQEKQFEPKVCEDEAKMELNTVTLISPELQDLEEIDREAVKLADKLKSRSQDLVKFIKSRLSLPVPLGSFQHEGVLCKINSILIEYHELISLLDKHKTLSQHAVIVREKQLSDGIDFGQQELEKQCKTIHENIHTVLKLIDGIIERQKKSRHDFIRALGIEYGGPYLSEAEIMLIGREKFRKIGEEKCANELEFSEHTKQKDFLDSLKLNFSGLRYLQEQIHPYLFGQSLCEQGFFSQKASGKNRAGISKGDFEALLGFILNHQYEKQGDIKCLEKSLFHYESAYQILRAEFRVEDAQYVFECKTNVEDMLQQNRNLYTLAKNG